MNDWHHAPIHRFGNETTFFITGGTYLKQHFYRDTSALDLLKAKLFEKAEQHECWLQAWCLLSNHYHLVVQCDVGGNVRTMLHRLHSEAADELNHRDHRKGREVWYQFWDKTLTFEASWLARLRYTHENAVHHRIVRSALQYPWCSASSFEKSAPRKFVQVVARMKTDTLKVFDDFDAKAVAPPPPHS